MSLSDDFHKMLSGHEEDAAVQEDAAELYLPLLNVRNATVCSH